jgi:hypothetical protein
LVILHVSCGLAQKQSPPSVHQRLERGEWGLYLWHGSSFVFTTIFELKTPIIESRWSQKKVEISSEQKKHV